jgi:hypothetical protein
MRGSVLGRLLGGGAVAALLALILWPVAARWDWAGAPYFVALAVTAGCGLGVLLLTGIDMVVHPKRGERVRPMRVFDIVSGAILLGFAMLQMGWLSAWLSP